MVTLLATQRSGRWGFSTRLDAKKPHGSCSSLNSPNAEPTRRRLRNPLLLRNVEVCLPIVKLFSFDFLRVSQEPSAFVFSVEA